MNVALSGLSQNTSKAIVTMLILLLSALMFTNQSSAIISYGATIQSTGTILPAPLDFQSMLGAGRSHWLTLANGVPIDFQQQVNLMASSGANTWREGAGQYNYDAQWYLNLRNMLSAKGMKLFIQPFQPSLESTQGWQEQVDIVYNNNGAQTGWINYWGDFIRQVQPYAIMAMNEYRNYGGSTPATSTEFAAYRQFCVNCINAWRAIKSDLVIVVGNAPFNDYFDSTSYGFAANPLPYDNIVYSAHVYYAADLQEPPSYLPDQQAYWNGNLALAKIYLTSFIDRAFSVLQSKGQQCIWDEIGARLEAPNSQQYVIDFFDICKAKGIAITYMDFCVFGTDPTKPNSGWGILTNDGYHLNEMGYVWASKMR